MCLNRGMGTSVQGRRWDRIEWGEVGGGGYLFLVIIVHFF